MTCITSLTYRNFRVIAALADLKLVARVADALNVMLPASSKQITELERIVGAPIVTRDRNRLHLTAIGLRLAENAHKVLNQIDRAAFDIEAMSSGASGAVTVGVVASVAPIILPDAISLLKRSAPETSVAIVEGHFVSLYPQIETGVMDLLIARVWQPQELPGIEQRVLFSEPVVVVAALAPRQSNAGFVPRFVNSTPDPCCGLHEWSFFLLHRRTSACFSDHPKGWVWWGV